jgi:ribosomal protein S18 acetylase RimI-like enzyme
MIKIRPATIEDISDLQRLNRELFKDNVRYMPDLDLSWPDEKGKVYFIELVSDPKSLCLIAEDGAIKVGYLAGGPKEVDYSLSKYAELQNMCVTDGYRSQGVGALLIDKFLEWAKDNKYDKAFMNAYLKNEGALSFYKKHGFEATDANLEKIL